MGPAFGNCLQCGSWGLSECKHKRIPLMMPGKVYSPCLFLLCSPSSGRKKREARMWNKEHVPDVGVSGPLGAAPRCLPRPTLLHPAGFLLATMKSFLTSVKQKRIKGIRLFTDPFQGPKIHTLVFFTCLAVISSFVGSLWWMLPIL